MGSGEQIHFTPQTELFRARMHGTCWTSIDIHNTEETVLPPGRLTTIPILLTRDVFPPTPDLLPAITPYLSISVRSRMAISGVHIAGFSSATDSRLNTLTNQEWQHIHTGERVEAHLIAINVSARPLVIPEHMGIFRFFSGNELMTPLNAHEIEHAMTSGAIHIQGDHEVIQDQNGVSVLVRLSSFWQKWIPPAKEPLTIPTGENYRGVLDTYLQDIPLENETRLWLGKTPHLTFDSTIAGVLSPTLYTNGNGNHIKQPRHVGMQIESRLIDPGTDWEVIIEGYGPTSFLKKDPWVSFQFVRSYR